jgi:hypothetical protein
VRRLRFSCGRQTCAMLQSLPQSGSSALIVGRAILPAAAFQAALWLSQSPKSRLKASCSQDCLPHNFCRPHVQRNLCGKIGCHTMRCAQAVGSQLSAVRSRAFALSPGLEGSRAESSRRAKILRSSNTRGAAKFAGVAGRHGRAEARSRLKSAPRAGDEPERASSARLDKLKHIPRRAA